MALLRAFWEEVENDPTLWKPLPPIGETWQMLERIQEKHPDHFFALLDHPQVGSWLAYTLRRHRGGAKSTAPWHVDFGQLNAVALAGAAMAGETFTTRVPLRQGRLMVPRFGMAHFPGSDPWDIVEAGVQDGRLWFRCGDRLVHGTSGADADGWWHQRKISVGTDLELTVWLEDLDPLRDLADPVPPARLAQPEFERWTELLRSAWEILSHGHREVAESLAIGVTSLVPLPAGDGWDTRSASTGDAFGAVMCSPPPDAVTLAVSLVHEFAHIRLGGLMHLLPMTEGGDRASLYAPWRDDPRPLGGLIQGIYAFVSIAKFWRSHRFTTAGADRELADFEYAYARMQADEGLAIARCASGPTVHGADLLTGLAGELESWSGDPLPDRIETLARMVALGHRTGWRLRHRRPDPDGVAALVSGWASNDPSEIRIAESAVVPDPGMHHWSQARLGLARRRIQSPQSYLEAAGESWGQTLTEADLALFCGDVMTAVKGFVRQIEDGEAVDPWAGLGLALSTNPADHAGRALLERPEVVRAVYRQIAAQHGGSPSPIEVARWIGAVVAT